MESNVSAIEAIGKILNDQNQPLKARFRALFTLRNLKNPESAEQIYKCFSDDSVLLKHELAYCLGQMGLRQAVGVLSDILQNEKEHPMVRHEAAEALGAIGCAESLSLLRKYANDGCADVAQTCDLAIRRIEWFGRAHNEISKETPYFSVDPAPPTDCCDVKELEGALIDESLSLWDRYRAMFALRNIGTDNAVRALATGLSCTDSALFRHEIAYVLGQIQSDVCMEQLCDRLVDKKENCMVRHECAEALGSIGTEKCEKILRNYLEDEERVVRESCQVALDMHDYENSAEFQYANSLLQI